MTTAVHQERHASVLVHLLHLVLLSIICSPHPFSLFLSLSLSYLISSHLSLFLSFFLSLSLSLSLSLLSPCHLVLFIFLRLFWYSFRLMLSCLSKFILKTWLCASAWAASFCSVLRELSVASACDGRMKCSDTKQR